ncbi:MAG: hypothetical protein M1819_003325 [Sarea resinae]|nr:MAG: hypothetical protein M1819_003325 [Sarea resinae]
MAEDQAAGNTLSAAFPTPPPFFKHFTEANLRRLEDLRKPKESQGGSPEDRDANATTEHDPLRLAVLPSELRYLIPPEPPTAGTYRSFGDTYNIDEVLPSLADQGIEQLYPAHSSGGESGWTFDHTFYLRKIAKSLLLNFLELVGVLSVAPEQYGRKIEDLRTLFVNAHHLINEYRPHQARESLIMMMEEQLERSRRETEGVRQIKEKVERILEELGKGADVSDEGMISGRSERTQAERRVDEQRRIWEALEKEFDELERHD